MFVYVEFSVAYPQYNSDNITSPSNITVAFNHRGLQSSRETFARQNRARFARLYTGNYR